MPKLRLPRTTQIPDEIFDEYMAQLSGAEFKVLLYIARRTFGFRKEADAISVKQICSGITRRDGQVLDRGTGLSRSTVIESLGSLESRWGLIVTARSVIEGTQESDVNVYRLNLEDDQEVVRKSDHLEDGGSPKIGPPVVRKSDHQVVRKSDPQQTVLQHPENNTQGDAAASLPGEDENPGAALEDEDVGREAAPRRRPWSSRAPKKERRKGLAARIGDMRASGEMPDADVSSPATRSEEAAASDTTPSVREALNFAEQWNLSVPEKPVDAKILTNPHAFRDENFRARFPEICEKARSMIQLGADISLMYLIRKDSGSGLYNFERLLLGDLDWMTRPKSGRKPDDDWKKQYA